ncbi:unnamed protein product, partial [marine sediment metagenome]
LLVPVATETGIHVDGNASSLFESITITGNDIYDHTLSSAITTGIIANDITTLWMENNTYINCTTDENLTRTTITNYFGTQAVKTNWTTTEILDKTSEVNTNNKHIGQEIVNTTTQQPLWTWGTSDVAPWKDAQAATKLTPV